MDIVLTWPATRSLQSYLDACASAEQSKRDINYRVARLPAQRIDRCYVVYRGFVRGWHRVVDLKHRAEKEVLDPLTGEWWPAGQYIVRDPEWHPIERLRAMSGFQGWRYYN